MGVLTGGTSALPCHHFVRLLDLDKPRRCLGTAQVWVVAAQGNTNSLERVLSCNMHTANNQKQS